VKCINAACRTSNHLESLWAQTDGQRLAKRFQAYNVVRRMRRCKDCGHRFYTIEIPERDFLLLLDRAVRKTT
jgi:transcriptional regulator NrdR family protein